MTCGVTDMADYWSHRAQLRRLARLPDTGSLFEWDRLRPLDAVEYEYWSHRPLPYGWSIIQPPVAAAFGVDHA